MPTSKKPSPSAAFLSFGKRQHELNQFLWTTELTYALVEQRDILATLAQDELAVDELGPVVCEALFPNAKGDIKYKGTVKQMRKQLRENIAYVTMAVAGAFITDYEVYVEKRFPTLMPHLRQKNKNRPFVSTPAPADLLPELAEIHNQRTTADIEPMIVLKADLMKHIRNQYTHKGADGIPRSTDYAGLNSWRRRVAAKDSARYTNRMINEVIKSVIGGAVQRATKASTKQKKLGVEFFYGIFTLTNIRRFVECVESAYP